MLTGGLHALLHRRICPTMRDKCDHASRLAAPLWPAQPLRTDGGHRQYSDDDVQQALKILDWVKKGAGQPGEAPCCRARARRTNNWLTLQETMLQRLKEGKIESLRQLIYDAGREYPRQELVTEVLRPLRSQVSANVPRPS